MTRLPTGYPEYPKYLSEDNTHRHGDIWMPLTAVSYVACHFPDVEVRRCNVLDLIALAVSLNLKSIDVSVH